MTRPPTEVIKPQPGPQTLAAQSTAQILFYGGVAGGGKTWFLAYELAKHVHIPGYVGVITRKNLTQLTGAGGAWTETEELYPQLGARGTQAPLLWTFPSGARIHGKHLENESNRHLTLAWQGNQCAYLGVDEATQFRREASFWYMWGRCRTKCGIEPRMRLTCNPDPDSWVRRIIDWWIGPDGLAIPERSGVIRWVFRDPRGDLIWSDTEAEALAKAPEGYDKHFITSISFIHASLDDNKKLLEADPGYKARLNMLSASDRARMRDGNWDARPASGDFFQRAMFKPLPASVVERALGQYPDLDKHTIKLVRVYDFAATAVKGNLIPGVTRPADFRAKDESPDWTASVLLAECRQPDGVTSIGPRYVILDIQRYQDAPGAIRQWVKRQAIEDGPRVKVALFQDPGQAGLDQIEMYKKLLTGLAQVFAIPTVAPGSKPSGGTAKQLNAKPVSMAVYDGRMYYSHKIPRSRLFDFFNEIEAFPDDDKPPAERSPDDQVDAFSGAFRALSELPSWVWGKGAIAVSEGGTRPNKDSAYWVEGRGRESQDVDTVRPGGTVGFERGF